MAATTGPTGGGGPTASEDVAPGLEAGREAVQERSSHACPRVREDKGRNGRLSIQTDPRFLPGSRSHR